MTGAATAATAAAGIGAAPAAFGANPSLSSTRRASRAASPIGFVRKPMAPHPSARARSLGVSFAVHMITGMVDVRGSAAIMAVTS